METVTIVYCSFIIIYDILWVMKNLLFFIFSYVLFVQLIDNKFCDVV